MNILLIGVADQSDLMPMLQEVIQQPVDFFLTDSIAHVPSLIVQHKINLFVIDLQFPEEQVAQLIDTIDSPHNQIVRGVFISDEVNNNLAIQGIKSYVMKDYILRPYDEERIVEMWMNCLKDRLYQYHTIGVCAYAKTAQEKRKRY